MKKCDICGIDLPDGIVFKSRDDSICADCMFVLIKDDLNQQEAEMLEDCNNYKCIDCGAYLDSNQVRYCVACHAPICPECDSDFSSCCRECWSEIWR